MFCDKCGAPLAEDTRFCAKCGNAIVYNRQVNIEKNPELTAAARLNKVGIILTGVYAALVILLYLIVFTSADLGGMSMTAFVLVAILCTGIGIAMFFVGRKVLAKGEEKGIRAYRAAVLTLFIISCMAGILLVFMTMGAAIVFIAAMVFYQLAARMAYAAVKTK